MSSDGSGIIEIHKKILIFGNVIQKIIIIFGITLFFYYLCPKIDKVYEVSQANAARHDRTASVWWKGHSADWRTPGRKKYLAGASSERQD